MTTQIQPTETDVTPDGSLQIAAGFMAGKHLFVASEIDLFAQLAEGPATLDDLALCGGVGRRTLRISADAMVALRLLERTECSGRQRFLSGQVPADLPPVLRSWNRINYPTWEGLEQAILSGQAPNRQGGGFSEADQRIFFRRDGSCRGGASPGPGQ